ncbi:tetratricopeptide repeat protein [Azospirillum rugosum]|uniref:Tetratricopeptide (TPR) repeat protein n=1 Tax=Azospirillum rugosum TaxID=416170 RepID=A0ABS4STK0_9PROT|nr:tetratricopeptide repeat protein [Azospirillum rugosum]MBP2295886.1 tetratricopeptide (TPR) repeat protein [Azospirillum rugosum]MDQ0530143.1 tetratricopeptide (TPR) repeat protein [Azospirillum rugosum]
MATVQEALLIAFDHQQAGRLAEADALYQRILDAVPGHPPALHLRGLLLAQGERLEEACALIERAIEGDGTVPDYHSNLGTLLEALGRVEPATDCLIRAARLDPTRVVPLNGFALRRLKDGARPDLAERALRAAIDLQPLDPDLRVNLAQALDWLGQSAPALAELRRAALLAPGDPALLRDLAERLGVEPGEAGEQALRRALRLDPARPSLWDRLGTRHKVAGRLAGAHHAYERGLALDPAGAELWNNRASVLKGQGAADGALAALRIAATLQPASSAIRNNLGDALMLAGRPAEALEQADAALAVTPDLADARLARATALLTLGRFAEGWDAWEDRWAVQAPGQPPRFPQPAWTGEPLGEGRLLVWGEQGVGDELQFAALLPLLTQAGVRCRLECDARLAPLLARSLPAVEVVARTTPPDPRLSSPDIAAQIPSGSLPRLLLRDAADFRRLHPYLVADPARTAAMRAADGPADKRGKPLVGIAWHTTNPKWGRSRNIPLPDLARALHAAGARMVVLQYGDWAGEVAALAAEGIDIAIPPGLDLRDDLDGLAARIAATDLVVTIDNVTAHMAGALGHPAWVLLGHAADWRWLRDRPDSPWYPSATLFRQPAAGDWGAVLDAVTERLCQVAGGVCQVGGEGRESGRTGPPSQPPPIFDGGRSNPLPREVGEG